ncbi:NAD(P)H-hydrate dehydratase [Roseomonas sp. SSH11]|uniref:Bifunctional NAD(P)H-hydrate repair enzyme n=1 Tax=Pararoseomonas baculiformis TaxID=2820812 RepID=A0ABS4AHG3_9PROT|nr:NAD(P)H-hydrate dehydratase [Pararoseomonas baculiformis]MBP0445659.1 NAD(P)H-hydrate dehydratase [Pararoseomonas baculiformis]
MPLPGCPDHNLLLPGEKAIRTRWPLDLLTPAAMARADAASAVPVDVLMAAAGRAVARAAMARFRACRTLVLAGPGNNGGDGYVAARLLHEAGWPVAVATMGVPRPGGPAAGAAARWRGSVVPFTPEEAARAGLVIDALLGAAPSRPLGAEAVSVLRAAGGPILAVDVPSGLDGATGAPLGEVAQAALTVTFARLKPGHLLLPGRLLCGVLRLADIGLPEAALADALAEEGAPVFRNAPGLWHLPPADPEGHKYKRGHVVVAGGAMPGAARLAASAARRGGAGLVTLAAASEEAAAAFRIGEPGAIVAGPPVGALLEDARRGVWVIGPGMAPDGGLRGLMAGALRAGRAVVADAGGLTAFAGAPEGLRGAAILTPHAGEFARLFGEPGPDRLGAARRAASATGAVVVLKGPDSVIAAPDGRAAINHNAPPSLATAGTGDVLAGLAGALLAQGLAPFEAACAAVWLQGEAAPEGPGTLAEDVVEGLPGALARALRASPVPPALGKPAPLR